jgi:iron complex transport system ATP-binding protein
VNLTRELSRLGFSLTGGIAHEHDSDEKLWRNLGIECQSVSAFSRIGDAEVSRAAPMAESADVTILCSFPIGPGNLGNLRLAARARRLFVLQPGAADLPRSFFSVEGQSLFDEICGKARVLGYEQILAALGEAADAP